MNAGLTFETPNELYEYHRFMCVCSRLAREGSLANKEYVNFLGARNHVHGDTRIFHVGGDVWCYRAGWWDTATDVICKSEWLLVKPNFTFNSTLSSTSTHATIVIPQLPTSAAERQEVSESSSDQCPGGLYVELLKRLRTPDSTPDSMTVVFVSAAAPAFEDSQLDALLCNLHEVGEAIIHNTAFLLAPSVSTIRRIQAYCNTLDPSGPRPFVCFTFSAMQAYIENHQKRRAGIPILVLGPSGPPNASLVFNEPGALYECHAFLCRCAAWSRAGVIANKEFLGAICWWDAARSVISSRASARLLVGDQTDEH